MPFHITLVSLGMPHGVMVALKNQGPKMHRRAVTEQSNSASKVPLRVKNSPSGNQPWQRKIPQNQWEIWIISDRPSVNGNFRILKCSKMEVLDHIFGHILLEENPLHRLKNWAYIWQVPPINRFLKWPLIQGFILHLHPRNSMGRNSKDAENVFVRMHRDASNIAGDGKVKPE